jgi:hypothetical protein
MNIVGKPTRHPPMPTVKPPKQEFMVQIPTAELTDKQLAAIAEIIERGNRAELIPVKNGVKIIEITRKEIKIE